jgi:GNAT superfamily N-acetyltransferase
MPELQPGTASRVRHYWASHFGIRSDDLFSEALRVITHGGELQGYTGAYALFRDKAAVVSLPSDRAGMLRPLIANAAAGFSPLQFAEILKPFAATVIGPAFIGYAESGPAPIHPARALGAADAEAAHTMRAACSAIEWEHGGSDVREQPASGVFLGESLVALAGYEIWGSTIAHISIVTHPAHRGHGYGRAAVAHLTSRALTDGLVPQYRTLDSNRASLRIAMQLGFARFASSIAIRFSGD